MILATVYKGLSNKPQVAELPAGKTLAQCFPEEDLERAAIFVNSRAEDGDYLLRDGDNVFVRFMPGGLTSALITIAIVAVAAIAATAIVVGTQIYKQKKELAELQSQLESMESASGSNIDNRPFLRGASNTAATSKTQPYICGRHLFTPYLLSDTFYEITGTDGATQYANTMLEGGFCPQVIHAVGTDDINILERTDASPQEGVYSCNSSSVFASGTVEIRQSGALMTSNSELNYKHVVTTANEEVPRTSEISSGDAEDYVFTLDSHAMDVEVCISFSSGLYAYNSDGDMEETSVTITPQYSLDGGSSWTSFTFYNSYTGTNTNTFKRNTSTKELRYTAKKTFSLSDYATLYANGENVIQCRVRSSGANDSQIRNTCYVLYYQSKCFDPNTSSSPAGALDDGGAAGLVPCYVLNERERKKSAMIGVRLESTSSNEDKLSKIFVISSGVARTWDGSKWSSGKSVTRNPAAWALEILTSDTHALSKFEDGEIDLESFGDFYEYCEENDFCFDYVISSKTKKDTVLGYITDTCGAALYTDIYGRKAIAIDRAQENAVAVYNPQNIISIENEREFARRTDCVRVTFTNSEDDLYEEDTCSIMREVDGVALDLDEDTVITDVTANGITTYEHAAKYARRCMAIEILRPKKTTIEVGNEGIFFAPYSKILLQDDSLKIGTGSAVVKGVNWQNGIARSLVLKNPVTVEAGKDYGCIVECFTDTGTARLSLKVSAEPGDAVDELCVDTLLQSTDSVIPEGGEVLSFGELDESGDFTKITTPYVIAGISRTESGFSLELANYDEAIYDSGSIPEYRSNITQRPVSSSAEIPDEAVSLDDVYQAAKSAAQGIISGTASVGDPDTPASVSAIAERDGISLSCELGDLGLRNDISCVTWEIERADGSAETSESGTAEGYYAFDRDVDGYPEADELVQWRARCKAENRYSGESEWSEWAQVSAASYGTWLVSAPTLTATASGRTITLTILQPTLASGRTRYGTFLNKVWIQKPSEGEDWYKPATSLDPYASEDNWQEGEGYVLAETVYTQTMPLTGQTLVDTEVDGSIVQQSSPEDTLYRFRVQAYSEAGEGEYSEINATALGTGIQDLVQGSVTHDKISTPSLSAINANMGYITSGAFQGSALNYWALSTIQGMQSQGMDDVWEGAFRVGGEDEYLLVEPQVANSAITGYKMYFKAGVFDVTAEASTINGELTIQASEDALDRTRITPTATYWEHRETVDGEWEEKARVSQSGIRASNLMSERSLTVSNMDVAERRRLGHDIGREYLGDEARVWHFDTDFLDQNGEEGLAIEGTASLETAIEPAILAVSPYAEDAAVAYGEFSASISLEATNALTVDFWIHYIWNETQPLFDIGSAADSVRLASQGAECAWNEAGAAEPPFNEEGEGECAWNEPDEASTYIEHRGEGAEAVRVGLADMGISLSEGEWMHLGVVLYSDTIDAYIGKARRSFPRNGTAALPVDISLNASRGEFCLDELYIDTGARESFSDFCENTDARVPWGALDHAQGHFVLDAKNLATNIFDTDAFREAVIKIVNGG